MADAALPLHTFGGDVLLFGRRRDLSAFVGQRAWGLAWCLAVLLAHAWAWRWFDGWQPMSPTPPPRLAVQLTQALQPQPERLTPRPRLAPERASRPASTEVTPPEPAASEPAHALPEADTASVQSVPMGPLEAASAPLSWAATPRDGEELPGPEWPLSTRLRYAVVGHYQGPVHGDAEVEWLRQGARYQVRLRVGIGPRLTPFGQRRLVSEGRLTPTGIAPQRYDEETQMLWRTARQVSVQFEGGEARLASGRRVFAPLGVQDSASQFVHLTWLLLTGREPAQSGHVIPVTLALPQGVGIWRYENLGLTELSTALGPVKAWHLRPQLPIPPGSLAAQVWLAPSYQYLPVQIRIEQGEGVWLTLTLAEPPLQEAPPPDNATPKKESPP